jgi:hypothetical protein
MIARIADIERPPAGLEDEYANRIRAHLASRDGSGAGHHLVGSAGTPSTVRIADIVAAF